MRSLQLLVLALLTIAARADGIPAYPYFYTCESGVVDCSGFGMHGGGGWSNGLPSIGFPELALSFGLNGYLQVTAANSRGEAIGTIYGGSLVGSGLAGYAGLDGQSYCLRYCGEYTYPVDINNNGLFLFNSAGSGFAQIGFGSAVGFPSTSSLQVDQSAIPAGIGGDIWGLGINDSNQVLVSFISSPVKGVLSPFAVPEPSAVLLLATVVVFWGARRIKRGAQYRRSGGDARGHCWGRCSKESTSTPRQLTKMSTP